jgi:hypothetical protein
VEQRRCFAGIFRFEAGTVQVRSPDAFELRDIVAVDPVERRVALIEQIAAVGQPAFGRQRDQFIGRERRCADDRGIVLCRGRACEGERGGEACAKACVRFQRRPPSVRRNVTGMPPWML